MAKMISRLLSAAAALVLAGTVATTPVKAAFIGGLDGVSISSTFEVDGIIALPNAGWETIIGTPRMWDKIGATLPGNNGSLTTGEGEQERSFENFGAQYATGASLLTNNVYTLSFDMGFITPTSGGEADYKVAIGILSGSIFNELASKTGTVAWAGNIFQNVVSASATLQLITGASVTPGQLTVQVFQTRNDGIHELRHLPPNSGSFAFDNVTLDATAVPLPLSLALFIPGLALLGFAGWWRRRAA